MAAPQKRSSSVLHTLRDCCAQRLLSVNCTDQSNFCEKVYENLWKTASLWVARPGPGYLHAEILEVNTNIWMQFYFIFSWLRHKEIRWNFHRMVSVHFCIDNENGQLIQLTNCWFINIYFIQDWWHEQKRSKHLPCHHTDTRLYEYLTCIDDTPVELSSPSSSPG